MILDLCLLSIRADLLVWYELERKNKTPGICFLCLSFSPEKVGRGALMVPEEDCAAGQPLLSRSCAKVRGALFCPLYLCPISVVSYGLCFASLHEKPESTPPCLCALCSLGALVDLLVLAMWIGYHRSFCFGETCLHCPSWHQVQAPSGPGPIAAASARWIPDL